MTTRYYEERECVHGYIEEHYVCDERELAIAARAHSDDLCLCPGGQRRELTGVEIVATSILNVSEVPIRVIKVGGPSGRYAIIPLD